MAYVAHIDVSYGSALVPGHKRVVGLSGTAVSISAGTGTHAGTAGATATPVWLWVRMDDDAPLTDISILYDDEPVPEGFERVSRDLSVSGETDGFEVHPRALTRSGPPVRLAMRYEVLDAFAGASPWAEALKVGDYLDAQDGLKKWRQARVKAVSEDGRSVVVAFQGASAPADETYFRASKKLAKPGTHTTGRESRPARVHGQALDVDAAAVDAIEARMAAVMAGELPADDVDGFVKVELLDFIHMLMTSRCDTMEQVDRVNQCLQKLAELVMWYLRKVDDPLPREIRQQFMRLFMDDKPCQFFYERHAQVRIDDAAADRIAGWAATLSSPMGSRCFCQMVNHFHAIGGYDALLQRLQHINAKGRASLAAPAVDGASAAPAASPSSPEDDTLNDMLHIANIVFLPRLYYTAEWSMQYFQPLRDAIMERILTMSDSQLRRADRELMDGVRLDMEELGKVLVQRFPAQTIEILEGPTRACAGDTSTRAYFERYSVNIALRLIRSDNLPMRVKAITEIRDMVEAVNMAADEEQGNVQTKRSGTRGWGSIYAASVTTAKWFTVPKYLSWLAQNRVLDTALGDRINGKPPCPVHSSTLSRLIPVLEFVASQASKALVRRAVQSAPTDAAAVSAESAESASAAAAPEDDPALPGITPHHVDLLFGMLAHDDDALRRVVFEAVAAIAGFLPVELLDLVYEHIARIPIAQVDDAVVSLLRKFSDIALTTARRERLRAKVSQLRAAGGSAQSVAREVGTPTSWADAREWYGLQQLLAVSLSDSALPGAPRAAVVASALEALSELLKPEHRQAMLLLMIDRCLDRVRTGSAASQAIRVLQSLLQVLPTAPVHGTSIVETLQRLQTEQQLLKLLVEEAQSLDAQTLTAQALTLRLDFLRVVCTSGNMPLSYDFVRALWATYAAPAVSHDVQEAFFAWLGAVIALPTEEGVPAVVDFAVLEQVFTSLFCATPGLDTGAAGPNAYKAFVAGFKACNAASNALVVSEDACVVRSIALAGLPQLWAWALYSGNKDVARDALRFLIDLHVRLQLDIDVDAAASSSTPDEPALRARHVTAMEKQRVWEAFVARCMEVIEENRAALAVDATASVAHRSHTRATARALRLLTAFLEAVEASAPKEGSNDVIIEGGRTIMPAEGPTYDSEACTSRTMTAFVKAPDEQNTSMVTQTLDVEVRPALETLGGLRDRLAEALGVPGDRMRLHELSAPTKLITASMDGHTLWTTRMFYGICGEVLDEPASDTVGHTALSRAQRVEMQLRLRCAADRMSAETTEALVLAARATSQLEQDVCYAPRKLLAVSAHYFEVLFSLLSLHASTIVADAWGLLQSLPTNPKVEADIVTLCGRVSVDGTPVVRPADSPSIAVDWDAVLDATAPLKLLYSLQIIQRVMDRASAGAASGREADASAAPASDDAAARAARDVSLPWVREFVASGGVAHLYKVLHALDLPQLLAVHGSPLLRECVKMTLSVASRLLVSPALALRRFEPVAASTFIDRAQLMRRMVVLLSYVTTVTAEREDGTDSSTLAPPDRQLTLTKRSSSTDGASKKSDAASGRTSSARREQRSAAGSATRDKSMSLRQVLSNAQDEDGLLNLGALFTIMDGGDDDQWEPANNAAGAEEGRAAETAGNTTESDIVMHTMQFATAALLGGDEHVYNADASPPTLRLHEDALAALYDITSMHRVLLGALCAPQDAGVRMQVVAGFTSLAELSDALPAPASGRLRVSAYLTTLLLKNVASVYAFPENCKAYFSVLQTLLQSALQRDPDVLVWLDPLNTLRSLASLLASHPVVELGAEASDVQDSVLQGLLGCIRSVLTGRSAADKEFAGLRTLSDGRGGCDLIEEVFENCLFAVPTGGAQSVRSVLGGQLPKCKAAPTRKAAFDVLVELATGCPSNASLLCDKLLPHHDAEAAAAEGAARSSLAATRGAKSGGDDEDAEAPSPAPAPADRAVPGRGKYGSISSTDVAETGGAASMSGRSRNLMAPRSSTGYAGLRNLGCICYMNSTMQQFFMNLDFRRGVLSWKEPGTTAAERGDSLMYQLQREFAYLQESAKQYFNPKGLCNAIKDWEGNPTDIAEQKDVPEFLTKLFSDLETQCQGTPLATLPKDVFGGVTIQELIAEDPRGGTRKQLYRTREEDFYFVQLLVKNNRTLQDALSRYVAGETVDFKWELPPDAAPGDASKPVDAAGAAVADADAAQPAGPPKPQEVTVRTTRRVSFRSFGDHLMLHLNRFEFDYETMQQQKVNDRFEFPREIDMWPYTVYGREDSVAEQQATGEQASGSGDVHRDRDRRNYIYELVGVVIHMGSAIGGHYYSYIRERGLDGPSDRWFEFNDSFVSPWEGSDRAFENDCFGGTEVYQTGGYTTTSYATGVPRVTTTPVYTHERVKSTNAFCLFYDRKRTAPSIAAPGPALAVAPPAVPDTSSAPEPIASLSTGAAAHRAERVTDPNAPALVRQPAALQDAFDAQLRSVGAATSSLAAAVRVPVPRKLLATIQSENLEFWRLRTIYEVDYFEFVHRIVRCLIPANEDALAASRVEYPWGGGVVDTESAMRLGGSTMPAIRLAVAFMLNTLSDSNQLATLSSWSDTLRALMKVNVVACFWLVQNAVRNEAEFKRLLLDSWSIDSVRSMYASVLQEAVLQLWAAERAPPAGATAAPAPAAGDDAAAAGSVVGRMVQTFVDRMLLDQLPRLHMYWRRFQQFFGLWAGLAAADTDLCGLLIDRGSVGRLIDFALLGDGPHPELNAAPGVKLQDRFMGDNYSAPNFENLLRALTTLTCACTPPSGLTGCPYARAPQRPLSSVDADMLTCRLFVRNIAQQLGSTSVKRMIMPLMTHLLWGAHPPPPASPSAAPEAEAEFGVSSLLDSVAGVIAHSIRVYDHAQMRMIFRFIEAACDVGGDSPGDELQSARIDYILRTVSSEMKTQSRFYRATEIGIERWTKLVKGRPLIAAWMSANADEWVWMERWLLANPRPPAQTSHSRLDDTGMRLFKGGGGGYYYSQYNSMPLRDENTLENVRFLLAGDATEYPFYESDDEPESVLQRRCTVRFAGQPRVLDGVVIGYDRAKGEHLVRYGNASNERFFNLLDHKSASVELALPRTEAARRAQAEAEAAMELEAQNVRTAGTTLSSNDSVDDDVVQPKRRAKQPQSRNNMQDDSEDEQADSDSD